MKMDLEKTGLHKKLFFKCISCAADSEISLADFINKELPKILDVKADKLNRLYRRGNLKFYPYHGFPALQFRKGVEKIESGTMICFSDKIEVIRGFPKIRRTLMLSPTLKDHFNDEIAVEEKMNGYNVRIALIGDQIIAFTRRGYICPFTTKKATEILNLDQFFQDNPDLVICGEMIGTNNPYVAHYYEEIGSLGFRIFDLRWKLSNTPLPIKKKRKILKKYDLPPVRLLGIYEMDEAPEKIKDIIKKLGDADREGVVIKDPNMQLPPLKYTSSRAHASELRYAFTFPFDFGRPFFFSRVIREGFQSFEMRESGDELQERAHRIGEAILYPMVDTIKHVAENKVAGEDLVIEVDSEEEAEEFVRYLRDLGVIATVENFKGGKAIIRRIHQSTTDKITNYLRGGLY